MKKELLIICIILNSYFLYSQKSESYLFSFSNKHCTFHSIINNLFSTVKISTEFCYDVYSDSTCIWCVKDPNPNIVSLDSFKWMIINDTLFIYREKLGVMVTFDKYEIIGSKAKSLTKYNNMTSFIMHKRKRRLCK